jgi:uncharacterized protein YceK
MKKVVLLAAGSALLLSGCASIIDGRSEEMTINTNPPGAKCNLVRKDDEQKDEQLGSVNSTPGTIKIEKTKEDVTITCSKAGYENSTYINHSGIDGATYGNIALGGLIGWGVDSARGADNHYDSPVNLTLAKK